MQDHNQIYNTGNGKTSVILARLKIKYSKSITWVIADILVLIAFVSIVEYNKKMLSKSNITNNVNSLDGIWITVD